MKVRLLLIAAVCSCLQLLAQRPNFDWANKIGDEGITIYRMVHDNNGHLYIHGFAYPGNVDIDPGPGIYNVAYGSFIAKYTTGGDFVWAGVMRTTEYSCIYADMAGNIYLTEHFNTNTTIDVDPGPANYPVSNNGTTSVVALTKFDKNMVLQWTKTIPCVTVSVTAKVTVSDSGYVYIAGELPNGAQIDVDPGPGTYYLPSAVSFTHFMVKLDANGNFVWARRLSISQSQISQGFSPFLNPGMFQTDKQGDIYYGGSFGGTVDADPGDSTFMLDSDNEIEVYVLKLNAAGNFAWAKKLAGGYSYATGMQVNSEGDVYVAGYFDNSVDFDPGPGTAILTAARYSDGFLLKLDSNGGFKWVNQLLHSGGGWYSPYSNALSLDSSGNAYLVGSFYDTLAYGLNSLQQVYTPSFGGFALSVTPNGNLKWLVTFTDSVQCVGAADKQGNIYAMGEYYNGMIDFNPGAGTYNLPATAKNYFLLRLEHNSICPTLDIVPVKIQDGTCSTRKGYAEVQATNGAAPYSYSWHYDTAVVSTTPVYEPTTKGIYIVSVTDATDCTASSAYLIDIPDTSVLYYQSASLVMYNRVRAGFPNNAKLSIVNNRCISGTVELRMVLPNTVTYNSASPTPSVINGDTLLWQIDSLTYSSGQFAPLINFTTGFATQACFTVIVTQLNGSQVVSNTLKEYCYTITGAYDPNLISVYPGACEAGYILPSQQLEYTIVFQNTGNDTALNIYVLDSLDTQLDISTLDVTAYSHPVVTEILAGNAVKFRYDNIYLVDSLTNEPLSHGYVTYTIQPAQPLTDGAEIFNEANIYFDFNAPIKTNTVLNTAISSIPGCITKAKSIEENAAVSLFPNPAHNQLTVVAQEKIKQVTVLDLSGKEVYRILPAQAGYRLQLPLDGLANGMYLVQVSGVAASSTQKFVVQH